MTYSSTRFRNSSFGDSVAQSITNQWQPRVGLVYTPDVTQKVSASFGRFYQQLPVYSAFGTYVGADNWSNYYDTDPRVNPDDYDSQRVYTTREPMHVRVDDLEGEHADELTFGYERILDGGYVVGARGIYRTLRQAYILGGEQGEVPGEVDIYYGNPGIGSLDFLPEAERTYTALELTAKRSAQRFRVSASYVLSRNRGNYTGQYSSDQRDATPGNNFSLQIPEHNDKTKGLLPNDRTHVFKLHGTYRATSSLQGGAFFTWQSGTPLSEFGQSEFGLSRPLFLVERGSAGRTPSLWDLNLRLTYDLPRLGRAQRQGRLILDVLHLGSPREGVATDQWRYWGRDPETGEQTNPNPNFGLATRHQPPMSARLGFELDF